MADGRDDTERERRKREQRRERQARYRQRWKEGAVVLRVEIDPDDIKAMVDRNHVPPCDKVNRDRLAAAVESILRSVIGTERY